MFDNLTSKQKKILAIIGIIIVIGIIYYIYYGIGTKEELSLEENMLVLTNNTSSENIEEDTIIIHVTGAVQNPGIVTIKDGSRIKDAIEAAGGLTENADITNVNLAYVLEDGIKLRIPSIEEEDITNEDILIENNGENIIEDKTNTSSQMVNINKANQTELETLPGIGPSLASKIIDYRKENGNFNNIEDIKNVSGIGDSKYENIKDFICIK